MTHDVEISPDSTFARLTPRKDVTPRVALDGLSEMQRLSAGCGLTRFLVDARGRRYTGSAVDIYEFAHRTLPEAGFSLTWRVAVLASPEDSSHDFLGTAAANAGYYGIRVFKDYDEAVAWLRRE